MRALKAAVIVLATTISSTYATAQVEIMHIRLKNGTVIQHNAADISHIIFEDKAVLNALPLPQNVTATAGLGVVNVTWSPVEEANSYCIYRVINETESLMLGTSVTTSFVDNMPVVGANAYRIQAIGDEDHCSFLSEASNAVQKLAAPSNVAASLDERTVTVTWIPVSGATSYTVYRSADGQTFTEAGTSTTNSYVDNRAGVGLNYYQIRANAAGCISSANSETTDAVEIEGLPEIDGFAYVDLGLPSGTLWAACNIGAEKSSDYGTYFAWGETQTKSNYSPGKSTWYYTEYEDLMSGGVIDQNGNLTPSHDAATAILGPNWRMPTDTEVRELIDKCTWVWTKQDGHVGCLATGPSGASIFIPASGFIDNYSIASVGEESLYWSSTARQANDVNILYLRKITGSKDIISLGMYNGLPIRPVANQ